MNKEQLIGNYFFSPFYDQTIFLEILDFFLDDLGNFSRGVVSFFGDAKRSLEAV